MTTATFRAAVVRTPDGPDSIEIVNVPLRQPGPGEVRIDVRAAGVNFADILMVAGRYQEKPPLPFSPGLEIAGLVGDCAERATGCGG